MSFRITGLDASEFQPLFGMSSHDLRKLGAVRVIAETSPRYPDRIELRDAKVGESLILVNYMHQPASTPYKASHAVYVLENPSHRYDQVNQIPDVLLSRMISLRAFDDSDMMMGAELCEGHALERFIEKMLADENTAYIQLHYAKYGCYACRVDRVSSE
ncbi:DUF1203 domain-containing protein [Mangrovitalea sediminis]|uniref:DUF1203 domain-containing protein n=1 Tax=Mangrovitalea sediminis TaxID=1982043 RepID=UPI000BE51D27|nr:DUF1203 domain-containing protein [Mangrovitalea sediminis]